MRGTYWVASRRREHVPRAICSELTGEAHMMHFSCASARRFKWRCDGTLGGGSL